MLILSRRAAERIYLGDEIVLTIVAVGADKVRIGVKAPSGVRILRDELELKTTEQNIELVPAEDTDPLATLPFPTIMASHSDEASERPSGSGEASDGSEPAHGLRSFMQTRRAA